MPWRQANGKPQTTSRAEAVFEVGMTELVLLFVVALLVVGPDKLPDFARRAGTFIRRLRQQAEAARRMVEDELALGEHGDAFHELRQLRGEVAQLRAVVSSQAQSQQWWLPAADQEGRQGFGQPRAEPTPAGAHEAGQAMAERSMAPGTAHPEAVHLEKAQRAGTAPEATSHAGHEDGRLPPS